MNYKDTLNLPRTPFSMKANLKALEPQILEYWEKIDAYGRLRSMRNGAAKFILHDGPPYANGPIHIGHALNKILKDIVVKYKFLRGFDCPYIPGWDCHGLPVEHQLFKELKLTKHDVDASDFRKKAARYALKYVDLQRKDFKRLGLFGEWGSPYLTLDKNYEYNVIMLLRDLVARGLVYRGRKPVNWCARCETALAEAEVEYKEKESDSVYITFKVSGQGSGVFKHQGKQAYLLVWTTTPWTIISNVAVAVKPDLAYISVEYKDKLLIFARPLLPVISEIAGCGLKEVSTHEGRQLAGLNLEHPFLNRLSPVVTADFVSSQEGTGCVHIAPGHGAEDFSLSAKFNLPVLMPVNAGGIFEEPPECRGKSVKQAGEWVMGQLKNAGVLFGHFKIRHSYPHCWRCEDPIIFRATFQWFIGIDDRGLRSEIMDAIEKVRWVPASGVERIKAMIASRPDWCISRQRIWGIPIPALSCLDCGEVCLSIEVLEKTAGVFSRHGADSWFTQDIDSFIPRGYSCTACGSKKLNKEFDILDVWFESGASFRAVLSANPDLGFPADLYLEGSDQHRGWFQASLIPSVATEKKPSFKSILTHGFVVDSEGKKMSKSLGNVVAPQEIIDKYGAEVLRLWAAYCDYSEDIKISDEIIRQLADMYRKVRNTIRFILGNINDFDSRGLLKKEELNEVDRFMLARAGVLTKDSLACYENYAFYRVFQKIFNFCNIDLSSFYLDILKDRLYTFPASSSARKSAQQVLFEILKIILGLCAPVLSFTCEEAFLVLSSGTSEGDSVFFEAIDPSRPAAWIDDELLKRWGRLVEIRSIALKEIEKKRESGAIGTSLDVYLSIKCPESDFRILDAAKDYLTELFIVSAVELNLCDSPLTVDVLKSELKKCPRCWNRRDGIGSDNDFPDVCPKCAEALRQNPRRQ